jgi:hypothetical protein
MDAAWIPLAIGVAALLLLAGAMRFERRWRLIVDLPTTPCGAVFIGLVEVIGRVRCARPLSSYLTGRSCVHHRWTIEERWSRTVTETHTDSKGNSYTTTRTESGWASLGSGGEDAVFELVDDSGAVRVDPQGARVDDMETLDRECRRGDPLYYERIPEMGVPNSDHLRRFRESVVPLDIALYAIGQAREREDEAAAELAFDKSAPMYVLSVRGERSVASGYFWNALLLELGGLALAAGGSAWWAANAAVADPWAAASIGAGGFIAAWALGWLWLVHNSLIELHNRVRQGWANIDVQLKRRFDLIGNLVPIVEAYAHHESGAQSSVALLRSQLVATPPGSPGPDVVAAAPRLLAVAEAYPDLKAQGRFAALHASLVDCEDRIAHARSYYNDIAAHWNLRLQRFPDLLVAKLSAMREQALMPALDAAEAAAPVIKVG